LFGDAFAASRQLQAQAREAVVEILEFPLALAILCSMEPTCLA